MGGPLLATLIRTTSLEVRRGSTWQKAWLLVRRRPRADVRSPGGGWLGALREHRFLMSAQETIDELANEYTEQRDEVEPTELDKPRSGPQRSEDTRSGGRAKPGP
jgi:hypothetical protein